jgi:GntR family transcriptional regulator, transcriptional repressor for pyruvate dehydrogenase complex
MPLQPVSRRSVPDDVFEQVLGEVVSGALGPGEALPSERRLAEVLGVSRPAVREALQRMTQTRLVEVRHGGATTVRDFRRYAGLDLLPSLLVRGGSVRVRGPQRGRGPAPDRTGRGRAGGSAARRGGRWPD